MTAEPGANAPERRRWNDPQWTSLWLERERLTETVTADLVERLAPVPGQRVLEIGSGTGKLAVTVARRVASDGAVVGADISERLVGLAQSRAASEHVGNVTFVVADAQTDAIDGGPFDVAVSQFGVMFFDQPAVAFANVARHVIGGGRLVFACWQGVEDNPWHVASALAPYQAPPPPPAPSRSLTGPFALGDPDRVAEFLGSAGWEDIERTPHARTEVVGRAAIVGDEELLFLEVAPTDMAAARAAVGRHLARFERADGDLEIPIAFQIFSARRG